MHAQMCCIPWPVPRVPVLPRGEALKKHAFRVPGGERALQRARGPQVAHSAAFEICAKVPRTRKGGVAHDYRYARRGR